MDGCEDVCIHICSTCAPNLHGSEDSHVRRQCVKFKVRCKTKRMECGDKFMHLGGRFKKKTIVGLDDNNYGCIAVDV